ncbi:MAG: cbb3-type cytochrome oxidase assembly protein CcoS [Sandaracinaceae bacterium]
MEALILTLFVSLLLAGAFLAGFVRSVTSGAHEHGERLALLPLSDDRVVDQIRSPEDGEDQGAEK